MVKPSEPSLKIVPRPCLRLVTVRKGYVRLPSRACLFSPPPQMLRKAASGERFFERTEGLNIAVVPVLYGGELAGVVFATRQWEGLVYEPFLRSGLEAAILALLHAPKHF